jgi:hypothetical protein
MIVENQTPHPDREVERLVRRGLTGVSRPRVRDLWDQQRVIVHRRTAAADNREGFSPFDRSQPIEFWVEDSDRYPQPGARTWEEELELSAAHERWHQTHLTDPCPNERCEKVAEAYAHRQCQASGA